MFHSFIFVFIAIITGSMAANVTYLRVTYSDDPSTGFYEIPKLQSEATDWVCISNDDCTNSGKFNGYRYVPKEFTEKNDYTIVLLFDKQGNIAGIQFRLPWSAAYATGNTFNLDVLPMYLNDTDCNYMILTAYFVNPDIICETDPQLEGNCEGMWFQNGDSPAYTIHAPESREAAIQEGWTKEECHDGMGAHNCYRVDTWDSKNCTEIRPFFLLYSLAGQLQGLNFFTPGNAESKYLENPPWSRTKMVVAPNTPMCLERVVNNGINAMHVYFLEKPYELKCNETM